MRIYATEALSMLSGNSRCWGRELGWEGWGKGAGDYQVQPVRGKLTLLPSQQEAERESTCTRRLSATIAQEQERWRRPPTLCFPGLSRDLSASPKVRVLESTVYFRVAGREDFQCSQHQQ